VTKLAGQVWRLHFDGAIMLDSAPESLGSGVWHHVVVRRQGTMFQIFYDGGMVAQGFSGGAIKLRERKVRAAGRMRCGVGEPYDTLALQTGAQTA
jgi:hypothetical protein